MKQTFKVCEREPMWSWEYSPISGDKPFILYHPNRLKNWVAQQIKHFLSLMGIEFNTQEDAQVVRTYTIRAHDIAHLIGEFNYTVEMLFNERLKYCVMGPREFNQLVGESHINSPVQFSAQIQMGRQYEDVNGKYTQAIVWGISVAVLPWVKGLTMLPDLNEAPDDVRTNHFGR